MTPMKRLHAALLPALVLLVALNASATSRPTTYRMPAGVTTQDYLPGTILLRVDPMYRSLCTERSIAVPAFEQACKSLGTVQVRKLFPMHQPPANALNEQGNPLVDLSLIYELKISSGASLIKSINALLVSGVLLYAEPKFIPRTQYNPNDPSTGLQSFLTKISAYDAWDIHKGDTNTVIGITDTGTDMDHPDLQPNMKRNYADPVDGIDNDGDGFTDNYRGWDLGENDNDPAVNASAHGSHVSGCAAAVTDNNTGVASPGFYCKFLPIKISDNTGALTQAYEGIVYAADHGCQIINCSWGSVGGGGTFGQNIVDYATFNKNSLVIAAAGNNGANQEFYPAAYANVIAVASTGSSDAKSGFSNYGTFIDVCAPGSNIYSAIYDNTYAPQSGTSMASPVVAGAAAIVKSYFPSLNALQVGERIRVTCDNIYSQNSSYIDKLGKGRINMLNALTLSTPSVRMSNISVSDYNDDILVLGDTMRITADFTNYLDPTTNLVVTLISTSPYVTVLDNSTTIGALGTLASTDNLPDPFVVKINSNAPQNALIEMKFLIQDGLYNDFQMYSVKVNVDYLNITVNDVFTTNSSKGRICYNGTGQTEGLGFDFNQEGSLSYETGFMVGVAGNVSDNVRGAVGGNTDEDFQSFINIQKNEPGIWSDFDTYGSFNDNTNGTPLNLRMDYRTLSWTPVPFSRFHIFEYTIRNTGTTTRSNLFAGIFSDWDVQNYNNNKADQDLSLQMGYVYCTDVNGYYAGIKLLTSGGFRHYALDNVTGGGGGVDGSDGLDSGEKFTTLSTNRATAGGAGTGNDVIDIVGSGPFTLAPGDSVTVAFALIAGTDLADLQSSAAQAQVKYTLTTGIAEEANGALSSPYPNPASNLLRIPFELRVSDQVQLQVFDIAGRLVHSRTIGTVQSGFQEVTLQVGQFAPGMYRFTLNGERTRLAGNFMKD